MRGWERVTDLVAGRGGGIGRRHCVVSSSDTRYPFPVLRIGGGVWMLMPVLCGAVVEVAYVILAVVLGY